jgi:hypothetical protein
MATNEIARIEELLGLARQIAAGLEPLAERASQPRALSLRLAQAHALGLVDQLCDVAHAAHGSLRNAADASCSIDARVRIA